MLFQHLCRIEVSPENAQFAQQALHTPGMAREDSDLVWGSATLWDGNTVEVRLCGVPEKPAFMAAAVFTPSRELKGFVRTDKYRSSFEFMIGITEYVVSICTDQTLDKDLPKPMGRKTPPRSRRGQER